MAALTTNTNLLDGVGEFVKVSERELLDLLPAEDRDKGLAGTAMTPYHNSAWERIVNDFLHEAEFDLDDSDLSSDQETVLKAACCFRIMSDLYRRSARGDNESNDWRSAEYNESEYDRMKGRWRLLTAAGREVPIGQSIPVFRA